MYATYSHVKAPSYYDPDGRGGLIRRTFVNLEPAGTNKEGQTLRVCPFKSIRKIFFTAYFAFGGFTVRMSAAAMKHITPEITKELT